MTRAKDISKIVTDADLSGTLDVTGAVTLGNKLSLKASLTNPITFENQHSVTTDASISTFDDANGTLISLGSNFYIDSNGSEQRFNTGEENSAVVLNRTGTVQLKTGSTGATAVDRLKVDSAGDISFYEDTGTTAKMVWKASDERLGIGTSSPNRKLSVAGVISAQTSANDASILLLPTASENRIYSRAGDLSTTALDLTFRMGDTERMRIDTSGNVGIGTTTPNTTNLNSGTTSGIVVKSGGVAKNNFVALPSTGGGQWDVRESGGSGGEFTMRMFDTSGTHNVQISSNGNHFFNGGNVGIGLSSNIDRKLHVEVDNTYAAKFGGTAGGDFAIEIGQTGTNSSAGFNATGTGGAMKFSISGSEAMRIDTSSNLLVGTTSVMTDFGEGRTTVAIKGTGTADYASLQLGNNATTGDTQILGVLAFHDNTARNAQINAQRDGGTNEASLNFFTASAGNLGSAKMTIKSDGNVGIGTSSPATDLDVAGNILTSSALYLNSLSVGSMAYFSYSGGNSRLWNTVNGALVFGTNNTERMRILPSGGITFNGDTATANALDDYEEGTWTPAIATTTGSITINSSFSGGSYTKIGDTVIAWAKIRPLSQSSPTGGLDITGLPFTAKSGSGTNAGGVGQGIVEGSYSSDPNIVLAQVGTGSTSITLRRRNGATSTNDMATYLVDGNYYTFTVIYKI
jgi:hypothetical protein